MYTSRIWLYFSMALVVVSIPDLVHQLDRRQLVSFSIGTGSQASSTTNDLPGSTPPASSSSEPPSSSSSSSSSTTPTTSSIVSTPPVETPTPSTSSSIPESTPPPSSTPSSSFFSDTTSQTPIASVTSIPRSTVTITSTRGDGSVITSASTDFSASTSLIQPSGSANTDGSSGKTSTIDNATKSKIIGATVGVGGAIILAGLGFVAWRLWGKKKAGPDEDEIFMAGSSAHGEKLNGSSNSNGPFGKSNLEQYHANPGTNF